MAIRYSEKENADAVEFSEGHWTKATSGDGARIYTSTSDSAACTIRFRPPRADQSHEGMTVGSKVIKRPNGQVEIEHLLT